MKGEAESSDVQLGLFLASNPIHTFLKNADRAPDFLILQVRNQENERDWVIQDHTADDTGLLFLLYNFFVLEQLKIEKSKTY